MVRTQVRLTEKQVEALRKMASREGVSVAEIIRRAVDRAVVGHVRDWGEIRARAIAAIGCGHADVTDLSTRHDDYVVEAVEACNRGE